MNKPQRWAIVSNGGNDQGNKDIEDGDGGGSNPPQTPESA
jgi:hypothetical protein